MGGWVGRWPVAGRGKAKLKHHIYTSHTRRGLRSHARLPREEKLHLEKQLKPVTHRLKQACVQLFLRGPKRRHLGGVLVVRQIFGQGLHEHHELPLADFGAGLLEHLLDLREQQKQQKQQQQQQQKRFNSQARRSRRDHVRLFVSAICNR